MAVVVAAGYLGQSTGWVGWFACSATHGAVAVGRRIVRPVTSAAGQAMGWGLGPRTPPPVAVHVPSAALATVQASAGRSCPTGNRHGVFGAAQLASSHPGGSTAHEPSPSSRNRTGLFGDAPGGHSTARGGGGLHITFGGQWSSAVAMQPAGWTLTIQVSIGWPCGGVAVLEQLAANVTTIGVANRVRGRVADMPRS